MYTYFLKRAALVGTMTVTLVTTCFAQETGFAVKCEPTEISDIARVIRNKIYNALYPDTTIAQRTIMVKVRPRDKYRTQKTLTELLDGSGFSFDPKDLSMSIGGQSLGHACFTPADVKIYVWVKRKDGTEESNSIASTLQIPGAFATSTRLMVVPTPHP